VPLVAHSRLPSFSRLRDDGATVLSDDYAIQQDIRELHVGLLNMMPDAALEATERQFFRLVGESNQIAQFYMHPFTLPNIPRGPEGARHVAAFYESFDEIKQHGLDALIITGANVAGTELSRQPFWGPLIEVIDWAAREVTSTLCSCLATHAVMEFRHGQHRRPLPAKRWGVYEHRVVERRHPLVAGANTRFDVPHSRFNEVSREQFDAAGLCVLVESRDANVHLAVSEDLFRLVFFQGHPEYDTISLLKEYKREIGRYLNCEREDYPPFPEHYFDARSQALLCEYRTRVEYARSLGRDPGEFPETLLVPRLDNTWHDSAEAIINNWLGKIYQITGTDRRQPFMPGIDPEDPLGLKSMLAVPPPIR
jgi:homoserine O-succinyltransferase/O-acetyltransferase